MPRDYRAVSAERGKRRDDKSKPRRPRLSKQDAANADARNQHFQNIHRMRRVYEACLRAKARMMNAEKE